MKKIILAVAVAAVATMSIVSSASADVARYPTQTMTLTAVQPEGAVGQLNNVWTHTYNVDAEPVRQLVLGQRHAWGTLNGPYRHRDDRRPPRRERRQLHCEALLDSVVYSLANAPLDNSTVTLATSNPVAPWALEFKVGKTNVVSSNYRNHGDYVSQSPTRTTRPTPASGCRSPT